MNAVATIFLILIIWITFGFIGFLIEAKINHFTTFDDYKVRDEFIECLFLGAITFIIMLCCVISESFPTFMNWLLKKLNG